MEKQETKETKTGTTTVVEEAAEVKQSPEREAAEVSESVKNTSDGEDLAEVVARLKAENAELKAKAANIAKEKETTLAEIQKQLAKMTAEKKQNDENKTMLDNGFAIEYIEDVRAIAKRRGGTFEKAVEALAENKVYDVFKIKKQNNTTFNPEVNELFTWKQPETKTVPPQIPQQPKKRSPRKIKSAWDF